MGTVRKGRIYALLAALCFAICVFYGMYRKISMLIYFNHNLITWDLVVCWFVKLGFIVLLIIAKKNIGFLFFSGIQMIINIYYVVSYLSVGNVCALVASVMLFVTFLFNITSSTNSSATATKIFGTMAVIIESAGIFVKWAQWEKWQYFSELRLNLSMEIIDVVAALFMVIWLVSTLNAKENKAKTVNLQVNEVIGGADKLKLYKTLLDSGEITQEEFEKRKKEILRIN